MSAPAFTAGPWFAPPFSSVVGLGVVGGRGTMICTIATPPGSDPNSEEAKRKVTAWDEIRANARLIAAAPSMYEALDEIAKGAGPFNRDPLIHAENTIESMKEIANEALAKARGEQ